MSAPSDKADMDYLTDDAHSVYLRPRAIHKQKHIYMLIIYNARKKNQKNPEQWVTSLKAICFIMCMVILSDDVSTLTYLHIAFLTD